MKTTVKEITPQWASQTLETRNPRNRPMSLNFVDKLARDIKAGAWLLTHQGIAFDENGDLLDGQHRLAAIVKAGIPVQSYVTTGVPASTKINGITLNSFEAIDVGRARKVGQMLSMSGIRNANLVAATTRAVVNFGISRRDWIAVSTAQTHKALHYFKGSIERCAEISMAGKILKTKSSALAPICIYHTVNPQEAEAFLMEVGDVSGSRSASSRMLASYLTNHVGGSYACQLAAAMASASAVWNHAQNRTVQKLYANQEAHAWLLSLNPTLIKNLKTLIAL